MELPLHELKKGQQARIVRLGENFLSKRFLEVGITPGTTITLSAVAPFGDPIAIDLGAFSMSLRKKEAAQIFVVVLPS